MKSTIIIALLLLATLSTYPNPFNSAVTISLSCHSRAQTGAHSGTIGNPDNVTIEIFDINGRKILQSPLTPLIKGGVEQSETGESYKWTPDAFLGSGVYLVRATVGEETVSKRVVYLK